MSLKHRESLAIPGLLDGLCPPRALVFLTPRRRPGKGLEQLGPCDVKGTCMEMSHLKNLVAWFGSLVRSISHDFPWFASLMVSATRMTDAVVMENKQNPKDATQPKVHTRHLSWGRVLQKQSTPSTSYTVVTTSTTQFGCINRSHTFPFNNHPFGAG